MKKHSSLLAQVQHIPLKQKQPAYGIDTIDTFDDHHILTTLSAGKMGIWDWDIRKNEFTSSEQFILMHGRTIENWSHTFPAYLQLSFDEDRQMLATAVENSLTKGEDYSVE